MPDPVMRTQPEKYPARYIIYTGPGHADTARQISRMLKFFTVSIPVPVLEYNYNETITQFRVRAMTCYLAALVW